MSTPKNKRPAKASQEKPKKKTKKATQKPKNVQKNSLLSHFRTAVLVIGIILLVCFILFDVETIEGNSMAPTLEEGDKVCLFAPPFWSFQTKPGEILRIEDNERTWILRNIQQDSGKIYTENKLLRINNRTLEQVPRRSPALVATPNAPQLFTETLLNGYKHTIHYAAHPLLSQTTTHLELKDGELFVLGDNRLAAYDSRKFGAIPKSSINGKVLFTLYSSSGTNALLNHFIKIIE